ncbi:MAG: polyprenyl diphosphate synthase [Dehalococcoidales bacterium]|nr:polyprenyl diphosphate synthase [Dehalococcoidales bacterium]
MAAPLIKEISPLPGHVAIIMDGNGRWAQQRGLPRLAGHKAGTENVQPIIKTLRQYQIKYVTLYSFSIENQKRPKAEVNGLFRLLRDSLDKYTSELHENGIRLYHLGQLAGIPPDLQLAIKNSLAITKDNNKMTLSLALNYSGRTEILDAVRHIIDDGIPTQDVNEGSFSSYLYTHDLPDVDLVIRTGGELRISNFLMWQTAYAEYYFTDVLWPDFDEQEMVKALLAYSQRQRRFGRV